MQVCSQPNLCNSKYFSFVDQHQRVILKSWDFAVFASFHALCTKSCTLQQKSHQPIFSHERWLLPRFARLRICNFDSDCFPSFCSQFQRTTNRFSLFSFFFLLVLFSPSLPVVSLLLFLCFPFFKSSLPVSPFYFSLFPPTHYNPPKFFDFCRNVNSWQLL